MNHRLRIQRGRLWRTVEIIVSNGYWQGCDNWTRHWTWRHA